MHSYREHQMKLKETSFLTDFDMTRINLKIIFLFTGFCRPSRLQPPFSFPIFRLLYEFMMFCTDDRIALLIFKAYININLKQD